jgi:PII-like signaling protein
VSDDGLQLTVYFGESERAGGELLSDALLDAFERHGVELAVLLRGLEGFGAHAVRRTQRLLTASEDLPLASTAAGSRARIESLLPEVEQVVEKGLVTVERARLLAPGSDWSCPPELGDDVKVTVLVGRKERADGRAADVAAVEALRRHGADTAIAFLGVDGIRGGARRRARFVSRNAEVPVAVVAVGRRDGIAAALEELGATLPAPHGTLERVTVLKRQGGASSPPPALSDRDAGSLALWQKLTVIADEQERHGGHPLYLQLVRRLREAGAAGATVLRGFWGFTAGGEPHGDRLLSLCRHVLVATVLIDRPAAVRAWWPIVDELTDEAGLVTCETVPSYRAVGPDLRPDGTERPAGGERLQSDAS